MLLKIFKNRTVSSSGTWGTKNENNYEILDFEFPEKLEEYNKRIVYYLGNQKVWDPIIDNKAILTNAITTKGSVKAYIWCTKTDAQYETDVDFRTQIFVMNFYENDNADGIVPTPEQVDGFNTMLTAMNAKIDEVDALEQTIETAESTRQTNEQTRQTNEATRQSNEQTRQEQEAERERRTDEAIGNIEDKTAEYNANAEAKTTAFNNNATQKTNEFNSNYTQKVNDFNANASSKESAFNSNASSKTSAFNSNATSKTNAFNSNADDKTTSFNDNATQKTTNFDNNASEKTTAYNENAQEKIDEYDEHIVEYQAQIDELQEEVDELSENMPWNTTEQATEIQVTDAAKYSKNKLELFGNTEQIQYTGKNFFNVSDSSFSYGSMNFVLKDNIIKISIGNGNGGISQSSQGAYTDYNFDTNKEYRFSVYRKEGDLIFRTGASYTSVKVVIYIKYDDNSTSNDSVYISTGITRITTRVHFIEGKTPIAFAIGRYSPSSTLEKNQSAEYYVQLEEGSTATDYEPYVGGVPSPSPDYPQPIHVVTGENTIEVQGKNLFDQNVERKNAFSTGDIGQVVGYGNSSASYSYVNCAKVEANKTYTLSWKIDGTKGATSNRNSKIVDSNNIVLEEFATWINNTTHITFTPQNTGYLVLTTDVSSVDIQIEQGSTATSYVPYYHADYPINLGSLELCKIGNYQDYLYKENGNWYKYGAIEKLVLDGTETNWNKANSIMEGTTRFHRDYNKIINGGNETTNTNIYVASNYFKATYWYDIYNINTTNMNLISNINNASSSVKRIVIRIDNNKASEVTTFKEWLSENNTTVYYVCATPTSTQITDETLISQLDAIYEHLKLVKGTNHITITPSDLEPYVTLNYMQDLPSKLDNLDSRLALLE